MNRIDAEIQDLVTALNLGGIPTTGSCSGHGKEHGYIILGDERTLIILAAPIDKDYITRELQFNQAIKLKPGIEPQPNQSRLPKNTRGAMPLNLLIELWEKKLGEYDPINPPNMYGETIQDTIYYLKSSEARIEALIEEADQPCKHYEGVKWIKRCCDKCWQELKATSKEKHNG